MGVVYLADQVGVERLAVIKLMRTDLSDDETTRHRFQREARAVGRLNHPGIVQIFTMGTTEKDELYLAMEYVDGYPLSNLRTLQRPLPEWRAMDIGVQILKALATAHGANIVHRDLKPENVMLTDKLGRPDQVKVLDFGLVRMLGETTVGLTRTGEIAGTLRYMSPEQALGETLDHQSDLYSLGLIVYELLIGMGPWDTTSPIQYLRLHGHGVLPPPSERAPEVRLDPRTERFVMCCLRKDPGERYATAAAALVDAEAVLADLQRPPPSTPVRESTKSDVPAQDVALPGARSSDVNPDAETAFPGPTTPRPVVGTKAAAAPLARIAPRFCWSGPVPRHLRGDARAAEGGAEEGRVEKGGAEEGGAEV